MSIDYENITGAELLRADNNSQKINLVSDSGEIVSLISERQFWGDGRNDNKLYYEYTDASNKGWSVEQKNRRDCTQDKEQHLTPHQTEEWFKTNTFKNNESTITIIQGYAGCGKTIFANNLLRKYKNQRTNISYHDIYVDYDNNATEDGYLVASTYKHIINQFQDCLSKDDGLKIYNEFNDLLYTYLDKTSTSNFNVISLFREDGKISELARAINKDRNDQNKLEQNQKAFARQFVSATIAFSGIIKEKYFKGCKNPDFSDISEIDELTMRKLMEIYIIIDCILTYAININRDLNKTVLFYDNLDIIDNLQHVAIYIDKLQEIQYKLAQAFKEKPNRPIFNIVITVRKITYCYLATIIDNREVKRDEESLDYIKAKCLDISNLYSPTLILKHKAQYLLDHFNEIIPPQIDRKDIQTFLNALIDIPEKTLEEVGLSTLFNHNIRACANILEHAMKYSKSIIPENVHINRKAEKSNYTIWIHNICAVLQKNDIWQRLGYNTRRSTEYYPAALSRLILTYLYNQKRGFEKEENNYQTDDVSFKEIVETFEKFPFFIKPKQNLSHEEIQTETLKNYSKESSREKIVSVLTEMLKRNTVLQRDTINPEDEMELWRRPIYYTCNAFPLVDKKGHDNINSELIRQINKKDDPDAFLTSFCITDEGYTFIEKIVTNFEFFSVRFNGVNIKPLFFILDENELKTIISRVYDQVNQFKSDHLWLMKAYIQINGKSNFDPTSPCFRDEINDYLKMQIHPRTGTFIPQLHIVRTIFDHIYCLNDYRDYLIGLEDRPTNFSKLNKILVTWIGNYLELYRQQLYELLDGTVSSFSSTYLDLKYLYWRIYQAKNQDYLPKDDSGKRVISINRKCHSDYRHTSSIKISDEELLKNPFLIESDE